MTKLAILACLLLCACSKKADKPAEPTAATPPAATKTTEAPAAATGAITLGDATVVELVDRRFNKREKPARTLVLHADGKAELINDKTDQPWMAFDVKADGSVLAAGKPVAKLSTNAITDPNSNKPLYELAGNTVTIVIDGKPIKVTLADDGNITVHDSPYGTKWRVEAKDPAVRRTAFLVLAATAMQVALD